MSEETNQNPPKFTPKGEAKVSHCPTCGAESDELVNTNEWHTCGVCETQFYVRVK